MSKIMISELQETTSAPDSSYIAIDNGATTNKITIANYNTNANATAKSYAEASQRYSNDALAAKDSAVSAKNEAETLTNTASSYANAARASADAAAGSASEASGYVGSAQASATNALASARAAEASAAGIDDQVKLAKSWAVGNTGVRANEAVDNAMYWAGQAAAAAGGGVVSFNGRTGSVLPNAGDYSSDQIAHVNSDSTYTNVETALNEAQTNIAEAQSNISAAQEDIADKLDTYFSDSTQWDTTPTDNSTKPVTSGGVKAQFNAVNAKVSDLESAINGSYKSTDIHVVTDGVRNYKSLLNSLYALIDFDKINCNSKFVTYRSVGAMLIYNVTSISKDEIVSFGTTACTSPELIQSITVYLTRNDSSRSRITYNGSGSVVGASETSQVVSAGLTLGIIY